MPGKALMPEAEGHRFEVEAREVEEREALGEVLREVAARQGAAVEDTVIQNSRIRVLILRGGEVVRLSLEEAEAVAEEAAAEAKPAEAATRVSRANACGMINATSNIHRAIANSPSNTKSWTRRSRQIRTV